MKNNTIHTLVILLFLISLSYFILPLSDDEINEGFRGGKRGGGRRGGVRRGGVRRGGGRRGFRRGYRRGNRRFYKRSGYRYPYYYPYSYSFYDILAAPFRWLSPYGYTSYNWFDYRNCPSGCVANSQSPTGYSCIQNNSITSCRTDYDCSGCNVPLVTLRKKLKTIAIRT